MNPDELAERFYLEACSKRKDNKTGNPAEIGCKYVELFDESKHYYKVLAQYVLNNFDPKPPQSI